MIAHLLRRTEVLRDRAFGLFYIGYVSSLLGSGMSAIAMAWAVLESGETATGLGIVIAATIAPQVLLMTLAGVVADRYGRRKVMIIADLSRGLSQCLLALSLLLPEPFAGKPPIWAFVALAVVRGTGGALYSPAMSALTVEIAPHDKLGDANSVYQMASSITSICGAALGGTLVALTNPGIVVAIDAATFGVSVVTLNLRTFSASSRTECGRDDNELDSPGPKQAARSANATLWMEMAEGWHDFRSRTWLWVVTVQFAFFNFITWAPWAVLGPVMARQYLGGASAWGVVMAAEGIGAVIAGASLLGRQPRRPLIIATLGTAFFALPDIPMALRATVPWVAGTSFISGVGDTMFCVFLTSSMQQHVPSAKLARVSAFTDFPAFGVGMVGYLTEGTLMTKFGATSLFAAGATYGIVSSLLVLAVPAIRSVTWRSGEDSLNNKPTTDSPTADESRV